MTGWVNPSLLTFIKTIHYPLNMLGFKVFSLIQYGAPLPREAPPPTGVIQGGYRVLLWLLKWSWLTGDCKIAPNSPITVYTCLNNVTLLRLPLKGNLHWLDFFGEWVTFLLLHILSNFRTYPGYYRGLELCNSSKESVFVVCFSRELIELRRQTSASWMATPIYSLSLSLAALFMHGSGVRQGLNTIST